jgi:hypothetical protein
MAMKPTLVAAVVIIAYTLIDWIERRYLRKIALYLARVDGFMDE